MLSMKQVEHLAEIFIIMAFALFAIGLYFDSEILMMISIVLAFIYTVIVTSLIYRLQKAEGKGKTN